jgi:uncharacterized protein (DUF2141 family)
LVTLGVFKVKLIKIKPTRPPSTVSRPPFTVMLLLLALNLTISHITQAAGQINIAVYDRQDAFMDLKKARVLRNISVQAAGNLQVLLADLPPGSYAFSCYHDINGNGKLDTNWLGIPTEPYGFSNNARPKFRAPNWDEAKIYWNGRDAVNIRLDTW